MHVTPGDTEKLLLAVAGMVARDRLARGVRLNHPETVALLSTWVIERAREGALVAELMREGRRVLRRDQVMAGVPKTNRCTGHTDAEKAAASGPGFLGRFFRS